MPDPTDAAQRPDPPSFRSALLYWLKLGCVSFGGPAGQIALMHAELVVRRRWISERRFLHALGYCMVLPGPEAQQLATYMGWLMHRSLGGIAAGVLFVLPSLLLLIALTWIYLAFGHLPALAALLDGVKPAVTAIVAVAAWRVGARVLRNAWLWSIAVAAFVALSVLNAPFPLIVAGAAFAGHVGGRLRPDRFALGVRHEASLERGAAAWIDDDTPAPPHARVRVARVVSVGAVVAALWAAALLGLAATLGAASVPTQMGWFFTKAALLTFGGAYAVLPYVVQGAVDQHHWLTASQMIDGLALGETTPGPLIMVVAFVGFVGGWTHAVFGPDALVAAGIAAAVVATFFTFLPSFGFILVGAPFIESTHGDRRLEAPLTAITAAVAGVIANLAVFFAAHVFWPAARGGAFDPWTAAVGIAGLVALARWRVGVIPVVLASGAAGLAIGWLR